MRGWKLDVKKLNSNITNFRFIDAAVKSGALWKVDGNFISAIDLRQSRMIYIRLYPGAGA